MYVPPLPFLSFGIGLHLVSHRDIALPTCDKTLKRSVQGLIDGVRPAAAGGNQWVTAEQGRHGKVATQTDRTTRMLIYLLIACDRLEDKQEKKLRQNLPALQAALQAYEIGRASCRERVET